VPKILPLREDLMVQQQIRGAWQHMVAVICLNQTYRKQVKEILPQILHLWPTPEKMSKAPLNKLRRVIKPLGMWRVRSRRIKQMSKEFLNWDGEDASVLHGIGRYGSDSYRIFFKNQYNIKVTDKELRKYLKQKKKAA
jgi:endonuclease III